MHTRISVPGLLGYYPSISGSWSLRPGPTVTLKYTAVFFLALEANLKHPVDIQAELYGHTETAKIRHSKLRL